MGDKVNRSTESEACARSVIANFSKSFEEYRAIPYPLPWLSPLGTAASPSTRLSPCHLITLSPCHLSSCHPVILPSACSYWKFFDDGNAGLLTAAQKEYDQTRSKKCGKSQSNPEFFAIYPVCFGPSIILDRGISCALPRPCHAYETVSCPLCFSFPSSRSPARDRLGARRRRTPHRAAHRFAITPAAPSSFRVPFAMPGRSPRY